MAVRVAVIANPVLAIAHTGRGVDLPAGTYGVVDMDGVGSSRVYVTGPDGALVCVNTASRDVTVGRPYTVQVETNGDVDDRIWQAVHPAENVTLDFELTDIGSTNAFLEWVAGHQNLATDGRVLIWAGHNADTGAGPAGVVYFGRRHN